MASTTLPRENGRTMWVTFTWRGKYMNLQMFFPGQKTPTKKEITAAIQGAYPGAVCKYYYSTERDPAKALYRVAEEKVEEGVGRAAIGAGVGAMVGGPIGAAAGAAIGASMGKKKVTGNVQKKKPLDISDPHGNVAKAKKVKKEDFLFIEKDLNAAERRALPDKDFALPGKGKGPEGKQAGSYPIPDKNHARMALAMVAKHGTAAKKAKVKAAVKKKFPDIQQEAIERQAKDRTKLSQPHSVSGSRRDHSHDVDSALTDHVPGKGKGRIRKASKKEMRVSAMRDAGVQQEEVGVTSSAAQRQAKQEAQLQKKESDAVSKKPTTKEKQLARVKRQIMMQKMRGLRKDPGSADSFTT